MKSHNKKIVFFIDSPGLGGSEINAIKVMEFLISQTQQVEAVLHKTTDENLIAKLSAIGVPVSFFEYTSKISDFAKSFITYFRKLAKYKEYLCIVWCHHLDSNRWLQLYLALGRYKFYIVEQLLPTSYFEMLKNSKLTIPLKKIVVRKSQSVIICAFSQENSYQRVFNTKNTIVIPNTRNVPSIEETIRSIRAHQRRGKEINILSIARVTEQKDPFSVIRAISLIHDLYDLKLTWVGDGELLTECKKLVSQLNIESKVKFIGFDNEPLLWLAKADIFILASLWEGLPGSLIEAMAAKVPVVATDIPGNNELVIHEKTGLLVPVKDEKSIAEAFKKIIANSVLRKELINNAYQHVFEKYSMGIEQSTWLEIINKTNT